MVDQVSTLNSKYTLETGKPESPRQKQPVPSKATPGSLKSSKLSPQVSPKSSSVSSLVASHSGKLSPGSLVFGPRSYPADKADVITVMHTVNSSLMIVPINESTLQVNRRRVVLTRHSDGSLVVLHKGVRVSVEAFVEREFGRTTVRPVIPN